LKTVLFLRKCAEKHRLII